MQSSPALRPRIRLKQLRFKFKRSPRSFTVQLPQPPFVRRSARSRSARGDDNNRRELIQRLAAGERAPRVGGTGIGFPERECRTARLPSLIGVTIRPATHRWTGYPEIRVPSRTQDQFLSHP